MRISDWSSDVCSSDLLSLPEILIWQRVKSAQTGLKFRKQHPIGPYVADFYCSRAHLVVEVDGEAHERGDRHGRDEHRDTFMIENGYRVLRVAAADILQDADAVVEGIVAFAAAPLHRPADGPPPRAGEE